MSGKIAVTPTKPKHDGLKWVLVALLLITGVAANYYFVEQALAIRLAGWLVLAVIVLLIAAQTSKGKVVVSFAKEARTELRKVVWPTRQETIQTTILVMVVVTLMGLILWGLDSILLWAISKIANLA